MTDQHAVAVFAIPGSPIDDPVTSSDVQQILPLLRSFRRQAMNEGKTLAVDATSRRWSTAGASSLLAAVKQYTLARFILPSGAFLAILPNTDTIELRNGQLNVIISRSRDLTGAFHQATLNDHNDDGSAKEEEEEEQEGNMNTITLAPENNELEYETDEDLEEDFQESQEL